MRLLLIEQDAGRCARIRERLATCRPHAQLTVHRPVQQGALAPEFLAQGFDAVLLAPEWPGGRGLAWARELAGRAGFAPLVLLRSEADSSAVSDAAALGAYSVRDDLDGEAFLHVLDAAEQRQNYARAVWRASSAGRDAQRFGDAFIRGYRRIRRLAAGTLTDLYVAESERAGTLVALKVARDRQDEDQSLDVFRRFLQEYEIAQRIDNPDVVRIHDLGVSDEHAWLVMEYFPLGDLRRRMRAGLIGAREALLVSIEVARALQSVHAAGVLHRDLKPGNVMLRPDGSIALIDFGLSKDLALTADATDSGTIFGTPHYMSPEQGHAEPIDARSDLYSLGVMLFEMLTGEKPFRAENPMAIVYKHRKEPVPRLPERYRALQPLIERLLAKAPADRYPSAREATQALTRTLGEWLTHEARA